MYGDILQAAVFSQVIFYVLLSILDDFLLDWDIAIYQKDKKLKKKKNILWHLMCHSIVE